MEANNNSNIKFLTFKENKQSDKNVSKIYLVSDQTQIDKLKLKAVLADKLSKALIEKEDLVLSVFGAAKHFLTTINKESDAEKYRNLGAALYKSLVKEQIDEVYLRGLKALTKDGKFAFLEGMSLASYIFNKHKKQESLTPISVYIAEQAFAKETLAELQKIVEASAFAKTLVNEPLNHLNALEFSKRVVQAGKDYGFSTEILDKQQIAKLKMGGLLSVNRGSTTPPSFNILNYNPKNAVNKKPLVLVGKGVMFDTGGYSLKTGGSMSGMKCDMGGGAAVLGTIIAVAANKLPYHVIGLIPATDNMISADAMVVDDIITMMDGTTVEVQNTDAEGRLVLADALTYAKRFEPELVIDLATLTGAAAAITGPYGIAAVANTTTELRLLKQSGESTYERLIELPFWEEFEALLKSDVADLKNIGGSVGGASTAGKFLEHFTDYKWIHLDIAGAAFIKENKGYKQIGATAVGVRLLYHFIKQKSLEPKENAD